MNPNKTNVAMEPIIELIWSPEEELEITPASINVACLADSCAGFFFPPPRVQVC